MCQGSVHINKESHRPVLRHLASVPLQSSGTPPGFLPLSDVQLVIWVHTGEVTGVYSSSGVETHDKNLPNAFCAITVLQQHLVTLGIMENQHVPLKPFREWSIKLPLIQACTHTQRVTEQSYQFLISKNQIRCLQIFFSLHCYPLELHPCNSDLQVHHGTTFVNLASFHTPFRWKPPYRTQQLSCGLRAWVDHTNWFILLIPGKGYYSESPVYNIKLTHGVSAHLRLCEKEFLTHTSDTWSPAEGNLGQAH